MLRAGLLGAVCAVALALFPSSALAEPRVVLAFWPAGPVDNLVYPGPDGPSEPTDSFLRELEKRDQLSVGLIGTILGKYRKEQALLDITQGTRVSDSIYDPRDPPPLAFRPLGAGGLITRWEEARTRAESASVTVSPGLLTSNLPGGAAAYVGIAGRDNLEAIATTNEAGRVRSVSLGSADSLAQRTGQALAANRFVAVRLTGDEKGYRALDTLIARRPSDELLIVMNLPPTPPDRGLGRPPSRFLKLTGIGIAGLQPGKSLTSATTRRDGLVSSIDLLPTVLDHLGAPIPDKARGTAIGTAPRVSADRLERLRARWSETRAGRQGSATRGMIALGGLIMLILGLRFSRFFALRTTLSITSLAFMWWPSMALASAILEPDKRLTETVFIAGTSLVLGIVTHLLIKWPRAPIVPVSICLLAFTADLVNNSDLITRSVLGPSVIFGARYFGVSNELETLLPILLFGGLAAAMTGREKSVKLATIWAVSGLVLGVVVGAGRLGADVGGVMTIGIGTAAGTLMLLPGGITKKRLAIAATVPVLAIALLILIDLVTGGGGHLTRNLSRSEGGSDLFELVARRYELAFSTLKPRGIAYLIGVSLAIAFAIRHRKWLYAPLPDPAWRAALVAGLAAGIGGALTNDSGPVLLVNAVYALAILTAYIQAGPNLDEEKEDSKRSASKPAPEAAPPPARPQEALSAG